MIRYRWATRVGIVITLFLATILSISLIVPQGVYADVQIPSLTDGPTDTRQTSAISHRLIVELERPPLTTLYQSNGYQSEAKTARRSGQFDVNSTTAQNYISTIQAEQAAFVQSLQSALPNATVSNYLNENGVRQAATYQVVFNGISIDPGTADTAAARRQIARMPNVKAVHADRAYFTQLYTSTALINAPVVWNSEAIGGIENAGAGIKVASMDGGVHRDAPMFNGEGYEYPEGYGPNGLGMTDNNNGKIIVSRAYFREWDPPSEGDENPWPGDNGTSHGVHTAGIAAGNFVTETSMVGFPLGPMSGVAPKAYIMSYRVFYASVNGNDSFYTTEGLAALEDIAKDGADVLNNSWGEGPISEGGEFEPVDKALMHIADSGVFISMAAGNAGPGLGTTDHPSNDYIGVAATTTSGTIAAGVVSVTAPEPVPDTLQNIGFGTADFGPPLEDAKVETYSVISALSVDPANVTGCDPWEGQPFEGLLVLISRGVCFFSDKAYYAEQAGAAAVIIYNDAARGDAILTMSCGSFCEDGEITISSVFIGNSYGQAIVDQYAEHGDEVSLDISTVGYQLGNDADYLASFSSRGPGVGNVLKPDIAAPGVNIVAPGYTDSAVDEARHLGYGQASGTSMAAPHVAGAAALLRQIYPDWSNDAIKSAMMSTAKYMDIFNGDGTNAQPLDMGAGRLDVAAAMDPGVILDPPSISFGRMPTGTQETIAVRVTNITDAAETYALSTVYTGDSFTATTELPGFSASPASISIEPGETVTVEVTFDSASGMGLGDNQGYIVMAGDSHNAHMPAWARVMYAEPLADVLIIDNDFSDELGNVDYLWYYTSALDELGYSYEVVSTNDGVATLNTVPNATRLAAYKAVIHFTGDNFQPDGTFSVSTGLTALDRDRLVEYLNSGGSIIAMGQDMASALGTAIRSPGVGARDFYYAYRLSANYIQDSVSNAQTPSSYIMPTSHAPAALNGVRIDLTQVRKYTASIELSGDNEVPAVDTPTAGVASFTYDVDQRLLEYQITINVTSTNPVTITNAHIHTGEITGTGPSIASLFPFTMSQYVTDSITYGDAIILEPEQAAEMLDGNTYVNVHTTANPPGEVRGQVEPDAIDNQIYVDEIDVDFHDNTEEPVEDGMTTESNLGGVPLLRYGGPYNIYEGHVAIAHRDQPSLERPGTDYSGRSIYASFGLEGMNNDFNPTLGFTPTSRSELLGTFLDWTWASSQDVEVMNTTAENSSHLMTFDAALATGEGVSYRWDFGDDSDYVGPFVNSISGHIYETCGTYTVRAEITDSLGNVSLGSTEVTIDEDCMMMTPPMEKQAVITATMQANTVMAARGDMVYYTISGSNKGNEVAMSLMMTASVAASTTVSLEHSTGDWITGTEGLALHITDVAPGGLFQAVIAVQIGEDIDSEVMEIMSPMVHGAVDGDMHFTVAGSNIALSPKQPPPVEKQAVITATMQANTMMAARGDMVYYTISGRNEGNGIAMSLMMTASVAASTTVSLEDSTGDWITGTEGLTLHITDVAPGDLFQAMIAVQIDEGIDSEVTEIMSPMVHGAVDGDMHFTLTSGNIALASPSAAEALLEVQAIITATMQADRVKTVPGEIVYYTISGRNEGNAIATNLVLTASVPASTTFSAENSTMGWIGGTLLTLPISDVAPGGLFQAVIAVEVDLGIDDVMDIISPEVSGAGDDAISFTLGAGSNISVDPTAPNARRGTITLNDSILTSCQQVGN